jgi:hypothetical protein
MSDTQNFSEERIGGWITTGIQAYGQITADFSGGMEHMGLNDIWNNGVLRTTVSVLERGMPTQNIVGTPSFLSAIGDARRWLGDCGAARSGVDAAYSLALVITKPPETVLLVLKDSGGASVLFDSHSRAQRGVSGAHAVRFTNDRAAAAGLSALFPPTPGLEDCGYGAEMLNQFEATPLRRNDVVKPEAPTLRGQRAVANAGPAFAAANADAYGERAKKDFEPTVENADAAQIDGQQSKDEPYALVEGRVVPKEVGSGDHSGGGDGCSAGGVDAGIVGALRAALEKARDDLAASEAARSELANRNAALEAGLAAKQGQLKALQGGLAEAHGAAADLRRQLGEAEVRGSSR